MDPDVISFIEDAASSQRVLTVENPFTALGSDTPVLKKRRRILYVQRPTGGGAAVSLYELVKALDTGIYEPIVLFYRANLYCEEFLKIGAQVLVLDERRSLPRSALVRQNVPVRIRSSTPYQATRVVVNLLRTDWPLAHYVAKLIRDEEIDLVHHNENLRAQSASVIGAALAKVPQVCHVRSLRTYRWIDRLLSHWVNFFIYVSTAVEQQCRDQLGIRANKGKLIYNPFDLSAFADPDLSGGSVRAEFSLTRRNRVISNVGRLVSSKGHVYFLEAMAEVVRSHPEAVALIVGPADADPPGQAYYNKLKELVSELRLSDRVLFTGLRHDIPHIMAASDVVVQSASGREGFGRVVVEAMAAGKAVVGTASSGAAEIVDDQRTGVLVPPRDSAQMARAICQLLRNPEQSAAMGLRAQHYVQSRFSAAKHAEATQQVYEQLVGSFQVSGS